MQLPGFLPLSEGEPLLYFCDESHIRTSDWMAVGGLAVTPSRAKLIEADLAAINKECRLPDGAEVKWSKCKKRRDSAHSLYVDYLFDAISEKYLHFHVRFSPFKEYDHTQSGERKETDTISKAFYQLLLHRAGRYYGSKCRILVRPDSGDCTEYLPQILHGLNTNICSRFALKARPIAEIAPRDSKKEPLLQLLDVTLGALAAARNGSHEKQILGEPKLRLIEHVFRRGSIASLEKSDSREKRDFNIWNVTPQWTRDAVPTR